MINAGMQPTAVLKPAYNADDSEITGGCMVILHGAAFLSWVFFTGIAIAGHMTSKAAITWGIGGLCYSAAATGLAWTKRSEE
jgi:hypothetical protein